MDYKLTILLIVAFIGRYQSIAINETSGQELLDVTLNSTIIVTVEQGDHSKTNGSATDETNGVLDEQLSKETITNIASSSTVEAMATTEESSTKFGLNNGSATDLILEERHGDVFDTITIGDEIMPSNALTIETKGSSTDISLNNGSVTDQSLNERQSDVTETMTTETMTIENMTTETVTTETTSSAVEIADEPKTTQYELVTESGLVHENSTDTNITVDIEIPKADKLVESASNSELSDGMTDQVTAESSLMSNETLGDPNSAQELSISNCAKLLTIYLIVNLFV